MWVYDYLLTLGDEVRHVCFLAGVRGTDRCADKVRLVWKKILGRVYSTSSKYIIAHTVVE